MRSSIAVADVLLLSLFPLLFLLDCNAFPTGVISFVPQVIARNVSGKARPDPGSENPERSLRFWALVVCFTHMNMVEIETVENAGTENAAKRAELKVETYAKHALVVVETDLDKLSFEGTADVDVVGVRFVDGRHTEFEIEKREDVKGNNGKTKALGRVSKANVVQFVSDMGNSNLDRMEVVTNPWSRKDLELLCRLPFLVDIVSANWLFRKQQAYNASCWMEIPKTKFKRTVDLTGNDVRCLNGCMKKLDNPKQLVQEVKEKVKEIRTRARISFGRSYLDFLGRKARTEAMQEKKRVMPFMDNDFHDKKRLRREKQNGVTGPFVKHSLEKALGKHSLEQQQDQTSVKKMEEQYKESLNQHAESKGDSDSYAIDHNFDCEEDCNDERVNKGHSKGIGRRFSGKTTVGKASSFKGLQMNSDEMKDFRLFMPIPSDLSILRKYRLGRPDIRRKHPRIVRAHLIETLELLRSSYVYENCVKLGATEKTATACMN